MKREDPVYKLLCGILRAELQPAMGCTEPIAIAYAAALARQTLNGRPESAEIRVSGNIIKNAMAVTVPHTAGRRGIDAAAAAGIIAGDADGKLQVLANVTEAQLSEIDQYLKEEHIHVSLLENAHIFDILVEVKDKEHEASVHIRDRHTHITEIQLDGKILFSDDAEDEEKSNDASGVSEYDIAEIYDFAKTCDLMDVSEPIERQMKLNTAISQEGLSGTWGASVGKVLLEAYGDTDVRIRARAAAAAGSDARMAGCEMPVVINSGSGNQGITVSLPVIEYAKTLGSSHEELLRALVFANLVAIHEKASIGCLSAYCGAISAGCAAGAGIAYLHGGDLWTINHTIVNSLAILSGTICDGAKPSCAAKIASAVDAGILGYEMTLHRKQFLSGEGIVKKGVENTIRSIGRLAREGMKETDREILDIMIQPGS